LKRDIASEQQEFTRTKEELEATVRRVQRDRDQLEDELLDVRRQALARQQAMDEEMTQLTSKLQKLQANKVTEGEKDLRLVVEPTINFEREMRAIQAHTIPSPQAPPAPAAPEPEEPREEVRDSADPGNSRIVHAVMRAPCAECVRLRVKVQELETAGVSQAGAEAAPETQVSETRLAELEKELRDKDKFCERLKGEARRAMQEYKEVAKSVFGFSLAKHKSDIDSAVRNGPGSSRGLMYELRCVCGVSADDKLLVQATDNGKQVSLLQSSYLSSLAPVARLFFDNPGAPPLPALFAAISLAHFGRLTPDLPTLHPASVAASVVFSGGKLPTQPATETENRVNGTQAKGHATAGGLRERKALAPI